jgi:deoxycytidylate deaminase
MLINAGVQEIIYAGDYPDELAKCMLSESNLKIKRFK